MKSVVLPYVLQSSALVMAVVNKFEGAGDFMVNGFRCGSGHRRKSGGVVMEQSLLRGSCSFTRSNRIPYSSSTKSAIVLGISNFCSKCMDLSICSVFM
ncbi:hypothetical protein QVD17_10239 [Tagetes erecta]|uniref:Uncharacterized protein n=1 Tax=Tagetes erecta TaxID=13708 RepID=A0AAD8L2Y0_TARER|nr:hypothetical protein QVD17_10239 [Tagetes erecta]